MLLLAAATSMNCQVKNTGLASLAGATGAGGAIGGIGDADLAVGGQGAGGAGDAILESEAGVAQGAGGNVKPDSDSEAGLGAGGAGDALGHSGVDGLDGGAKPVGGAGGGLPSASGGRSGTGGTVGAPDAPGLGLDATVLDDAAGSNPRLDTAWVDKLDLDDHGQAADVAPDLPVPPDAIAMEALDTTDAPVDAARPLLWHDEFDGAANSGVDPNNWSFATWGPSAGVNNEKQQYTSSLQNVFLDGDSHLVIRASKYGTQYTSGRIHSNGKFSFQTGRLEVRAKLPAGTGSFPGIITMGVQGDWPACGELALMEQWGQDKSWFYASAYANSTSAGNKRSVRWDFPDATTASRDFHVYSVDVSSDQAVFQVDGQEVMRTSFDASSPFRTIPQYIVLDVAVGGNMGGSIDQTAFPMDMVVDYVRVYAP